MKTTVSEQFLGPVNGVCPCSNPDYPCYAYYQTGCSGALGYHGRSTAFHSFSQSYFAPFCLHVTLTVTGEKTAEGTWWAHMMSLATKCHIVLCLQVDFALASKSMAWLPRKTVKLLVAPSVASFPLPLQRLQQPIQGLQQPPLQLQVAARNHKFRELIGSKAFGWFAFRTLVE